MFQHQQLVRVANSDNQQQNATKPEAMTLDIAFVKLSLLYVCTLFQTVSHLLNDLHIKTKISQKHFLTCS